MAFGLAATLVVALSAGAANAQPTAAPPAYSEIDANGVDLASGALNLNSSAVSVGPVGAGGLVRSFLGRSLRDSLTGTIESEPNPIAGFPDAEIYAVSLGNTSAVFIQKNPTINTFLPHMNAKGQTLTLNTTTNIYTYTAADGTVATFSGNLHQQAFDAVAAVTSIVSPNGETLTYHYAPSSSTCAPVNCVRLQAVTNNLGYMIKYEYAGSEPETGSLRLTKVTAINLAHEYCDPLAATCATTNPWSSVTIQGADSGTGILTLTDSLNRLTGYFLTDNRITKIVSPSGVTVDIAYDGVGRVQTVTSPAGTWTYGYVTLAGNKLQTTVTDPLNHSQVVVSDGVFHRMLSHTDAVSNTTSFLYDWENDGRLQQVTYPEGNITGYGYDTRGNVTSVTQSPKPGSTLPALVTTAVYPATCTNAKTCNKPTSVTEQGATTDFTYDANHGGVLTVTRPAGSTGVSDGVRPQSRYFYGAKSATVLNASGALVAAPAVQKLLYVNQCQTQASCYLGAEEYRVVNDYLGTTVPNNLQPSASRIYTQGGATQSITSFTYTKAGDLATVDGPLASPVIDVSLRRYDSERQLVGEVGVDPDGYDTLRPAVANRYHYRGDGQLDWMEVGTVTSQSDAAWAAFTPAERLAVAYDDAGRPIRQTLLVGGSAQAVSQTSYDLAGRVECVAVRMNPAAFGSAPASACALGTTGSNGPDRIVRYAYDNADRRTSVTNAYGTVDQIVDVTTTYRPNGTVQTVADANGNLTTYEYDGFDRLSKTRFPSAANGAVSSTTDYAELTYDNVTGRVIQDRRRDGTLVSYSYDARGNLLTRSAPAASYTYDNFDAVRTATENGQTLTMGYDNLHRMTTVAGPLGTVTYGYDLAFQRTRMHWPDAYYVNYTRDWAGALTMISQQWNYDPLVNFQYDDLGRRIGITRKNGVATTYTYDPVSRLETLTNNLAGTDKDQQLTFGYNAAGQVTSRTSNNSVYAWPDLYNVSRPYQVNGLNQVTASGAQAVTHDPRGNLQSDGVTTYSYDIANRLTGTTAGAALSYDALGRLYEVTSSGAASTRFQYDGSDLITEYDSSGAVLRRYIHGPGEDEPLVWIEGATTQQNIANRNYLVADHQGSVVAVTNSSGVATQVDTYDEYGIPGAGNTGRFQYTGQVWIPEIDLYHYKARAYSPTLGRFLQTDPIGYGAGMNMYAYVGGDPVNLRDPSGLEPAAGGPPTIPKNGNEVAVVDVFRPENPFAGIDRAIMLGEVAFLGSRMDSFGNTAVANVDGITVTGRRRSRRTFGALTAAGGAGAADGTRSCPGGPMLSISPLGYGATGFLGLIGGSLGIEAGVAIPMSFFSTGSLRGMQLYGSASATGLAGLGAFAGAGPSYGYGVSRVPLSSGGSAVPVLQGGAGWGVGGELSGQIGTLKGGLGDLSQGVSASGSGGPKGSFGIYAASGIKTSYTLATPQLGC